MAGDQRPISTGITPGELHKERRISKRLLKWFRCSAGLRAASRASFYVSRLRPPLVVSYFPAASVLYRL